MENLGITHVILGFYTGIQDEGTTLEDAYGQWLNDLESSTDDPLPAEEAKEYLSLDIFPNIYGGHRKLENLFSHFSSKYISGIQRVHNIGDLMCLLLNGL